MVFAPQDHDSGDKTVPACAPRKPMAQATRTTSDSQRVTKKQRLNPEEHHTLAIPTPQAQAAPLSSASLVAASTSSADIIPPKTILHLPDELLATVLEFWCETLTDKTEFVNQRALKWRQVCTRFRRVYDQHGFLKRTRVFLNSPQALTAFITPGPLHRKPMDLFSGAINLHTNLVTELLKKPIKAKKQLQQQCSPHNRTQEKISEAMQAYQQLDGQIALEIIGLKHSTLRTLKKLAGVGVTSLSIGCYTKLADITAINHFTHLETVHIYRCNALADLKGIGQCTNLHTVSLDFNSLQSLEGLEGCKNLNNLSIVSRDTLTDISALKHCTNLHRIYIFGCFALKDISALGACAALHDVTLSGPAIQNSDVLLACTQLRKLVLSCNAVDLATLFTQLTKLEELTIGRCDTLRGTLNIAAPNLKKLKLDSCKEVTGILFDDQPHALHTLDIISCSKLQSLLLLNHCEKLKRLSLYHCPKLDSLSTCDALTFLSFHRCPKLTVLGTYNNLKRLAVKGDSVITDVTELAKSPNLVHLDLKGQSTGDADLLTKIQAFCSLTRLTLNWRLISQPQILEAIKAYCAEQNIKVVLPSA
ncbi:MAG: leucine-rich repeat domain-containing protein [Holosporaceae bacterium]